MPQVQRHEHDARLRSAQRQIRRHMGRFDDDAYVGIQRRPRWDRKCVRDEGPSMAGDGKMSKYQDIIELKSDDHRILASQVLGDDGKWNPVMTVHYRRR